MSDVPVLSGSPRPFDTLLAMEPGVVTQYLLYEDDGFYNIHGNQFYFVRTEENWVYCLTIYPDDGGAKVIYTVEPDAMREEDKVFFGFVAEDRVVEVMRDYFDSFLMEDLL